MQVKLKVLAGAHEGKEIPVQTEKFLIGRSDSCQLRPKSESVSRRHCALIQKDGRLLLIDLKSRNGTLVNGKAVQPDRAKILKSGDRIQVGQLEFELVMEMELGGARKPEVRSVEDVIERTVEQSNDNRSVEIDISSWLEEADQVDRGAVPSSFETRQLVLDDTGSIGKKDAEESGSGDEETKGAKPMAPGKLPKVNKGPTSKNSRDAAQETLKKYFGGRG